MIINEIAKNMKLILRNWSSLALLILGPLAIIFIIGLTFSGEALNDIVIGVYTNDPSTINDMQSIVTDKGIIRSYHSLETCINDLKKQTIHLCIDVKKETTRDNSIPKISYVFFYDASREKLSASIITVVQEALGQTADAIGIKATQGVLGQIQRIEIYLRDGKEKVDNTINELYNIRSDLSLRGTELRTTQNDFTPRYTRIKNTQTTFNQQSGDAIIAIDDLNSNLNIFRSQLITIRSSAQQLRSITPRGVLPLAVENEYFNLITQIESTSSSLLGQIDTTRTQLYTIRAALSTARIQFNQIITELDTVKTLLSTEIQHNDAAIQKVDKGIDQLRDVQQDLNTKLTDFVNVNPELAQNIIQPIVQEYNKVEELTSVQAAFPKLFILVIMFITLLFSSILALSEIHNDAFKRNLMAPVSTIWFALGVLITTILLVLVQVTVLLVIAETQLGIVAFAFTGQVYALSILLIILFSLVGMILSFVIKNSQTAILTTTFSALGFYLLSDFLRPQEGMPALVSGVVSLNPIVIAEKIFGTLTIYRIPLDAHIEGLLLLVGYVILLSLIALAAYNRMIRRLR